MRGRNADGTFQSPFNPLKWGDAFTEGNSWHYTWSVFHDPKGLMNLMGGKQEFNHMLDSVFAVPPVKFNSSLSSAKFCQFLTQIMNMGNYAHGNQPIQHMIYLYDYSGEPWKAQHWIREVIDRLYTAQPDGYCGDEDNGQTSAWYVFSAIGFYPVCPGSNQYALGAPLFKHLTLNLENGKKVIINAPANSRANRYIDAISINGKKHDKNYFTHKQLIDGATINVDMSDKPNHSRGTKPEAAPYSFSDTLKH